MEQLKHAFAFAHGVVSGFLPQYPLQRATDFSGIISAISLPFPMLRISISSFSNRGLNCSLTTSVVTVA